MKHVMILLVLASILVAGCAGGGNAPQTLEEHKAAAAKMEQPALIAKANDMLKAIDGRMPEIAELTKQMAPLVTKTDDASKATLEELKAKFDAIQADRKAQAEVMAVYKAAAKNAGAACAPAGGG